MLLKRILTGVSAMVVAAGIFACGSESPEADAFSDTEASAALMAGECRLTADCQAIYSGATDCRNSEGGVCYCGNERCSESPSGSADCSLSDAGISSRVEGKISSSGYAQSILSDPAMVNTLNAICQKDSAPAAAQVITSVSGLGQISSGGTYVIRGDLTLSAAFAPPANTTIYLDGTLRRNCASHQGENIGYVVDLKDASQSKLIGLGGARISSNWNCTGVRVRTANGVLIQDLEIFNVYQGVALEWNAIGTVVRDNYIHDTTRRALWLLWAHESDLVHNFIENAGWDGIDWDAGVRDNRGYQNVMVGWGRWAGFVEEGAHDNQIVQNLALMAYFENPSDMYTMGWADNGNQAGPGPTYDNYFVGNSIYQPSGYSKPPGKSGAGGDYFAKGQKEWTYFWGNKGYGAGRSTTNWVKAQWLDSIPAAGQTMINQLAASYPAP